MAPRLQRGTGALAPRPDVALQGPYVSRCLSSLSLYFDLRQGYDVHSSWGIVSINNLIAILYLSCVELRDAGLCRYLNVGVRSQVFCSPSILEKKWPFFFLSLNYKDHMPVRTYHFSKSFPFLSGRLWLEISPHPHVAGDRIRPKPSAPKPALAHLRHPQGPLPICSFAFTVRTVKCARVLPT